MSWIIGSFNLKNFSNNRDFQLIAKIIDEENFDIIGLQEMPKGNEPKKYGATKALYENLKNISGKRKDWEMIGIDSRSHIQSYDEGFVFIWNNNRFNLVGVNEDKRINIGIYENNSEIPVRPPMFARFQPVGLVGAKFFELRLINIHLAYNSPDNRNDLVFRRDEFDYIINKPLTKIDSKKYNIENDGDSRPVYTIILGDYNMCINQSPQIIYKNPNGDAGYAIHYNKKGKRIYTGQYLPTTLKRIRKENTSYPENAESEMESVDEPLYNPENNMDYYSHNYDHFSMYKDTYDKLYISVSRVEALEKYYTEMDISEKLRKYQHDVSDHVPIKIEIDFKKR